MAQPITKWQAFQSYHARENPGSSKQQAGVAWNEYKEKHGVVTKTKTSVKKSPSRRSVSPVSSRKAASPIKKSPSKKSPGKKSSSKGSKPKSPPKTEMHKLVGATLTGLPRDITGLITGYLPGKSLAMLQATSKRTKAITQPILEAMCRDLPTHKEIAAFVEDMLVFPNFVVSFFEPEVDGVHDTRVTIIEASDGILSRSYSALEEEFAGLVDYIDFPERRDVLQHVTPLANPESIRNILARRGSCTKEKGQYYADLMQRYIRGIIDPFLTTFLHAEEMEKMYAGQDIADDIIIGPPLVDPEAEDYHGDNPFGEYTLQVLRLTLALGWLRGAKEIQLVDEYDRTDAQYIFNMVVSTIRQIRQEYQYFKVPDVYTRTDIVYTTTDIVKYIQQHIHNKTSIRVAFYTPSLILPNHDRTFSVTEFVIMNGTPQDAVTHSYTRLRRIDTLPSRITVVTTPSQEAFDELLGRKIVPGIVDPLTLRNILANRNVAALNTMFTDTIILAVALAGVRAGILKAESHLGYRMLLAGRYGEKLLQLTSLFSNLLIIARWLGIPMTKEEGQAPVSLSQAKKWLPKILKRIDAVANNA